jgi:hypothetical protein
MAVASIDYEKVDMILLNIIQMISSLEHMASAQNVDGTADFIYALDAYRNKVALAIEAQGSR